MPNPGERVHSNGANGLPEPIRDGTGASILGPRNVPLERENPALLASPYTDAGTIPNLKFSFAAARNRLLTGGWAREITERELPIAKTLAGVNMRLKPGGIRELHWHKETEWSLESPEHEVRAQQRDEQLGRQQRHMEVGIAVREVETRNDHDQRSADESRTCRDEHHLACSQHPIGLRLLRGEVRIHAHASPMRRRRLRHALHSPEASSRTRTMWYGNSRNRSTSRALGAIWAIFGRKPAARQRAGNRPQVPV